MDKYLESIEARKQQLKRTENLLPMPIGCVIAALIQVDTTAATTGTASFVCRLRNTHMCLRSPADSSLRYSWATSTSRYLTSEIGECCPNFFIFCCHPPLCKPALVISASLLLARPPEPTTRVLPSPRPARRFCWLRMAAHHLAPLHHLLTASYMAPMDGRAGCSAQL